MDKKLSLHQMELYELYYHGNLSSILISLYPVLMITLIQLNQIIITKEKYIEGI